MKIGEKLIGIDRRIIFLVISVVMIVPIIFPFGLPIRISWPTQKAFDAIEKAKNEKNAIIISADLSPQDQPELYPMLVAMLRHCFHRKIKVLILCLYPVELGLAQQAIDQVVTEFNTRAKSEEEKIKSGQDYVFLSFKPPPIIPILGMGEDIIGTFQVDYYGKQLKDLPIMQNIRNYNDVDYVFSISAGDPCLWYIAYAQVYYGVKVIAGVTAVGVADYYPFLDTGQFTGLLEGMKGAAEYEALVYKSFADQSRRFATEGMSSQSATHLALIVFIIIGNIGYFLTRKKGA